MLKKQFRLKNKAAFTATYRIKNSFHKSGVTLFAGRLKNDASTPTRAGFVVSKKTHKRAVKRNQRERRGFEPPGYENGSDVLGGQSGYRRGQIQ